MRIIRVNGDIRSVYSCYDCSYPRLLTIQVPDYVCLKLDAMNITKNIYNRTLPSNCPLLEASDMVTTYDKIPEEFSA
jgi:hypothetical protein